MKKEFEVTTGSFWLNIITILTIAVFYYMFYIWDNLFLLLLNKTTELEFKFSFNRWKTKAKKCTDLPNIKQLLSSRTIICSNVHLDPKPFSFFSFLLPSFINVWLTNRNCIYLSCALSCFDMCIHHKMITMIN